jgi:tetratricopeptide (TPR) repeat protein
MMLARSYARVGKLAEAEQGYRSVCELYPDFSEGRYQLAMLLVERGRLDQAVPWLKAATAAGDDPYVAMEASWVFTNLGLTADAEAALATIKTSPGKELIRTGAFAERGDWVGLLAYARAQEASSKEPFWPTVVVQAAAQLGRDEDALTTLRKIRPDLLSPDVQVSPSDLQTAIMAANLLRRQGDSAQANLLLDRVLATTAPVAGARTPNEWRLARAKAFAVRGQVDAAIAELQTAVNAGWRTAFLAEDYVWIEEQPALASLRNDPRFVALVSHVRQDLAKQKAAVLAARR